MSKPLRLPPLRAREWSCHAATTIVGDVDGRQVVFAEVGGNGRYGDEDAVIASEIARRCNAFDELRAALREIGEKVSFGGCEGPDDMICIEAERAREDWCPMCCIGDVVRAALTRHGGAL